ncbi:MAG: OmpA family protein [Bacteroidales bacterium]
MRKCLKIIGLLFVAIHVCMPVLSQQGNRCPLQSIRGNWYLEGGVGMQMLFSKDAGNLNMSKRITPAYSLTAGKWCSPVWGVRFQATGYSLNGFSSHKGIYVADPGGDLIYGPNDPVRDHVTIRPNGGYRHYLRYMNVHADIQMSLFNWLSLPVASRGDIIPSVGIGYFQTFKYKGSPAAASLSTNFSLMGKYHLAKNWDVNLELQSVGLPDQFDGRISGQRYECSLSASLGVTYRLPFQPKYNSPKQVAYPVIEIQRDTVCVTKEVVIEKIVPGKEEKYAPFVLSSIRFAIGKQTPSAGQDIQFVNVARFMEENPDAKLKIFGYADADTGSEAYNLTLSALRAQKVWQILTEKYKISRNRLEVQGFGMNEQPYDANSWNRVVTIIPYW